MKKIYSLAAFALLGAAALCAQTREHRAVWWSNMLGEWPNTAITPSSENNVKKTLQNQLDKLEKAHINTIYFHVRANCDALYNSKYEPWMKMGSAARGGAAPSLDPFELIISEAHNRGIEVYAWVNPYRYSSKETPDYAASEKEYLTAHPDWLLSSKGGTCLNPGMPEVKQRVINICEDIVSKYDVDGMIFDDYFYINGTPVNLDAELYEKSKKGNETQMDWRRRNVNEMVSEVKSAIKNIKPYLTFAIGPAGVANHPDGKYPIPDSPASGYQYDGIAADPVAWMEAKSIDFISPQIYWTISKNYRELSDWWITVSKFYGVPSYTSVDISDIADLKAQEFINQIDYNRQVSPVDQSGISFFTLERLTGYREKYNGQPIDDFTNILASTTYPDLAINPILVSKGNRNPVAVKDLARNGNTITWTKDDNMRYVVYSVPPEVVNPAEVLTQPEYTAAVRYDNSYTIPAGSENNTFAVAAYDRYGYLYTPYIVGAAATQGVKPTLLTPADNEKVTLFASLGWKDTKSPVTLIIAKDPQMKDVVYSRTGTFTSFDLIDIPAFDQSITHYWQVISQTTGAPEEASEVRSFSVKELAINQPAEPASLTPAISWANIGEKVTYELELSESSSFTRILYSETTTNTSVTVPEGYLSAYKTYYARLFATKGDVTIKSGTVSFMTLEMTFDKAPEFIYPAADGATVHSNEKIAVRPITGVSSHTIQLAASNTFPSRSTTNIVATESAEAGTLKVSSKTLVDGKTYYLRSFATYSSPAGLTQKTPYSNVISFIYSAEAGVGDISSDNGSIMVDGNTVTLPAESQILVFDISGRTVITEHARTLTLDLPAGVYIIKACGQTLKIVL